MIQSLRRWWSSFVARHIVSDIPPELVECESCRVPNCTEAVRVACRIKSQQIVRPASEQAGMKEKE